MNAQQSQGQPGQSQSQGTSGLWGNDSPRASEPSGGASGEQTGQADEATSNAGTRFGVFDTGRPETMQQPPREDEDRVRRQAVLQEGQGGFGYGADGETEMADAPDATEREPDEHDAQGAAPAAKADPAPRHHHDEAKEAYFNR